MSPAELLALFERIGDGIREALLPIAGSARRERTAKPGQYAIDLVADAVALRELRGTGLAVLSEESGRTGPSNVPITIVLDPVDGSSNAARELPYWATSMCAVDDQGPLASMVVNQATAVACTAIRGAGAWCNGRRLASSNVTRVDDAFVAFSGLPTVQLPWKQCRVLGSAALALTDVATGALDAFMDAGSWHAPWDYLGGAMLCREAGATVRDAARQRLDVVDPSVRRQLFAAGTPALIDAMTPAVNA
jgi:fructose-1,6-bisphosphatase/inositol monophosphatase family enzyme